MQDLKPGHTVRDKKTQHGHASFNITNMDSGQEISLHKAKYASICQYVLALSYKGCLWCGCSCSKYSNTSNPGELQTSVSSLDELLVGLSLNVSLFNIWRFTFIRFCWPCVAQATPLARLSASQSLLPAPLVSLEDSASLSSPGLLIEY